MITVIIVVSLCYIIPTMLMLLFFKYTKIGKTASDDIVFSSFIPFVNIFYVFFAGAFLISDLLITFSDKFKSIVLKFVRGK